MRASFVLSFLTRLRHYSAAKRDGANVPFEVDLDGHPTTPPSSRRARRSGQDACVVDDDVEASEGIDGLGDEMVGAVPGADFVGVGDRLAAGGLDLVHNLLGGTPVAMHTLPSTKRSSVSAPSRS